MKIDVNSNGAVSLGPEVVCDGFIRNSTIRVQTHAHSDHTHKLHESLGKHKVVFHPTTQNLLGAAHPQLARRLRGGCYGTNVVPVNYGAEALCETKSGPVKITLLDAAHLIGSAQVVAEYQSSGFRAAYSGDFGPNAIPPRVDHLVIDSRITMGHTPWNQAAVMERLFDEADSSLRNNRKVKMLGHFGAIQQALHHLCAYGALEDVIVIGDRRTIATREFFIRHGFQLPNISEEHRLWEVEDDQPILILSGPSSTPEPSGFGGPQLILSRMRMDSPFHRSRENPNVMRFAMSNHADLEDVINFVDQSGASDIVIDSSSRASLPAARRLRSHIEERLGLTSRFSSNEFSPD